MNKSNKTCAFYTFGCKVNQYETQLIRENFLRHGYKETKFTPSVYVINGCSLTASAERKCRHLIKSLKKNNPQARLMITGCYAQNHPQGLNRENSFFLIPQDLKELIPEFLPPMHKKQPFLRQGKDISLLRKRRIQMRINFFEGHTRGFVKIQDGCSNFCSYCIVPYLRGKSISKNAKTVIQEISGLTEQGIKEVVLTGIDLGSWGKDFKKKADLAFLISQIEKIPNLSRLRLSSIELRHIKPNLMQSFLYTKKLCRHLHLPLQSGDDYILKKMNRPYTRSDYLKKVERLKKVCGDIAITTDIMIGFPGEEERHFRHTLEVVKEVGFSRVHIFPFSPRPQTLAAKFKQTLNKKTLEERRQRLQKLANKTSFLFRKALKNKKVEIIFEQKEKGCWIGYTDTYVRVKVKSPLNLKNRLTKIEIKKITFEETIGKI